MKKVLFIALGLVVAVAAYGKNVSEVLATFMEADEVTKVNIMEQPGYISSV